MGVLDCLHVVLPGLASIFLAIAVPVGYKVYKTGVRATASYIVGLPSRMAGFVFTVYSKRITRVFAVATALGGTIKAGLTSVSSENGLVQVLNVFLEEVYRETLSASGLLTKGFDSLTEFLVQPGVCSSLVNLDLIGLGLFFLWRGVAIVIVVLSLWGYYRSRGRKTDVDFDEKVLVVSLLFAVTTLVNVVASGGESTGFLEMVDSALRFLDALSSVLNGEAVNQSVGSSVNGSLVEGINQSVNGTG